MVEYDEEKGAFRVVIDKIIDGKRIRKTKLLPNGSTFQTAEKIEASLLDEHLTFREQIQLIVQESKPERGHIYAVRNLYFPGIVKIGMTANSVHSRIKNLSSAVPADFELVHTVFVNHALAIEQSLHAHFCKFRVNLGREFFKIDESSAIEALNVAFEVDGASLNDAVFAIGRKR